MVVGCNSPPLYQFVSCQLIGVFIIHHDLTMTSVTQSVSLGLMFLLFWSLTNIGLYYDNNSKALASEVARCVTALCLSQPLTSVSASAFSCWLLASLITALALTFFTKQTKTE